MSMMLGDIPKTLSLVSSRYSWYQNLWFWYSSVLMNKTGLWLMIAYKLHDNGNWMFRMVSIVPKYGYLFLITGNSQFYSHSALNLLRVILKRSHLPHKQSFNCLRLFHCILSSSPTCDSLNVKLLIGCRQDGQSGHMIAYELNDYQRFGTKYFVYSKINN